VELRPLFAAVESSVIFAFVGPARIGGRPIWCNYDTGSTDIVVSHDAFGNKFVAPWTSFNTHLTFDNGYVDGAVLEGDVWLDSFTFGTLTVPKVEPSDDPTEDPKQPTQLYGLASTRNSPLMPSWVSPCGMGPQALSESKLKALPFPVALAKAKLIDKAVFLMNYAVSPPIIQVGNYNPSQYKASSLVTSKFTSEGQSQYYTIDDVKFRINEVNWLQDDGFEVVLDTGAAAIVLTRPIYRAFFLLLQGVADPSALEGSQTNDAQRKEVEFIQHSCSADILIEVIIRGQPYPLSAESLSHDLGNGRCLMAVRVVEPIKFAANGNAWYPDNVLGLPFFRNVVTIFDLEENTFSVALPA